jgi:hypothetical protein
MPKAPVDENGGASTREDDVGTDAPTPGWHGMVDAEAEAATVELAPDGAFPRPLALAAALVGGSGRTTRSAEGLDDEGV